MEVSVGGTAWYAWWRPTIENNMRGSDNGYTESGNYTGAYNDTFENSQDFLAGPFVSLGFLDRWKLGLVALMSTEYEMKATYNVQNITTPSDVVDVVFVSSGRRYDMDSTLSYQLNPYMGLFLGYKLLVYDMDGVYNSTYINLNHSFDVMMHGPGAGISFSIPVAGPLFIPVSFSFIVMSSTARSLNTYQDTGITYSDETYEHIFFGYSVSTGIGYYMLDWGTTLVLGGRYQYMRNNKGDRDLFYGMSLSVIYRL